MGIARYRAALPQLSGDLFLCDAGIETDLIFNHRIEIRAAKNNTSIWFSGVQGEVDLVSGVKTHTSGTYDIF